MWKILWLICVHCALHLFILYELMGIVYFPLARVFVNFLTLSVLHTCWTFLSDKSNKKGTSIQGLDLIGPTFGLGNSRLEFYRTIATHRGNYEDDTGVGNQESRKAYMLIMKLEMAREGIEDTINGSQTTEE